MVPVSANALAAVARGIGSGEPLLAVRGAATFGGTYNSRIQRAAPRPRKLARQVNLLVNYQWLAVFLGQLAVGALFLYLGDADYAKLMFTSAFGQGVTANLKASKTLR